MQKSVSLNTNPSWGFSYPQSSLVCKLPVPIAGPELFTARVMELTLSKHRNRDCSNPTNMEIRYIGPVARPFGIEFILLQYVKYASWVLCFCGKAKPTLHAVS